MATELGQDLRAAGALFELAGEFVESSPVDRLERPFEEAREAGDARGEFEVEGESRAVALGLGPVDTMMMIERRAFHGRVFHEAIRFEDEDLFFVGRAEPRPDATDRTDAVAVPLTVAHVRHLDLEGSDALDVRGIGELGKDGARRTR